MSAQTTSKKELVTAAPADSGWRHAVAEAMEARADAIMAAIISLERLDGMFEDRREPSDMVINTVNMLRLEEDNLRKEAQGIRERAA